MWKFAMGGGGKEKKPMEKLTCGGKMTKGRFSGACACAGETVKSALSFFWWVIFLFFGDRELKNLVTYFLILDSMILKI